MTQSHSGIADCADYDQAPLANGALDDLTQRTIQIRLFKVSPAEIDDANVVFLFVVRTHSRPRAILLIGYVTGAANLQRLSRQARCRNKPSDR